MWIGGTFEEGKICDLTLKESENKLIPRLDGFDEEASSKANLIILFKDDYQDDQEDPFMPLMRCKKD